MSLPSNTIIMAFHTLLKDRVTKPQKKMLITLLRETKYMEGKKEKEWYWEKIQAALNTIGPKKTIIQWKKVSISASKVSVFLISFTCSAGAICV